MTKKRFALLLAGAMLLLTACTGGSAKLDIPESHREAITINCFQDTWSVMEDGSDWLKAVSFPSGTDTFISISDYLKDAPLSKADNAGNFMADFSFTDGSDGNGYDFKFTDDDQLVLRNPRGECSKVGLRTEKFFSLRELIGEIRIGIAFEEEPMAGGYSEDRAIAAEELAMFEEVMNDLVGVSYEPTLVATQVVAGMNYRFTATATPVIPEPYSYTAYVYIFKPLSGPALLLNIEKATGG